MRMIINNEINNETNNNKNHFELVMRGGSSKQYYIRHIPSNKLLNRVGLYDPFKANYVIYQLLNIPNIDWSHKTEQSIVDHSSNEDIKTVNRLSLVILDKIVRVLDDYKQIRRHHRYSSIYY